MRERVDWENSGELEPMPDLDLAPQIKYFPIYVARNLNRKGKL
jgi:hypothetical protein